MACSIVHTECACKHVPTSCCSRNWQPGSVNRSYHLSGRSLSNSAAVRVCWLWEAHHEEHSIPVALARHRDIVVPAIHAMQRYARPYLTTDA